MLIIRYNNAYHSTIKMKSVDVRSSIYIDLNKENNKEDHNLKCKNIKIEYIKYIKYQNISSYNPNWSEEYIVPWTYITSDLNGEEII